MAASMFVTVHVSYKTARLIYQWNYESQCNGALNNQSHADKVQRRVM